MLLYTYNVIFLYNVYQILDLFEFSLNYTDVDMFIILNRKRHTYERTTRNFHCDDRTVLLILYSQL